MQKESEYSFKVLLVGDPTVGKTSIILRFVDNVFIPDNVTTSGVNVKIRDIQFGKKFVRLLLADTVGQERFRTISRSMYRDADAVVVVYDQANEKSFTNVKFWINEVDKYAKEHTRKCLVSNKNDLEAVVVPADSGRTLAESSRMPFFEVSAKTDINIDSLFQTVVQSIGERVNPNEEWGRFKILSNNGVHGGGGSSSSMGGGGGGDRSSGGNQKRRSGFCNLL